MTRTLMGLKFYLRLVGWLVYNVYSKFGIWARHIIALYPHPAVVAVLDTPSLRSIIFSIHQ